MKKKKTILSLLFLAVLMGATYFVLAKCGRELDFGQVAQFISTGNKLYLVAALLSMFLFILLEAVSLRCIYRCLGQDTGFWPSIIYSASDIYYSAITPSAAGGQPGFCLLYGAGRHTSLGGYICPLAQYCLLYGIAGHHWNFYLVSQPGYVPGI